MKLPIIGQEEIEFKETKRVYDIVERSLPGAPRFFVAYNSGRPFISEEVPEIYRPPMVFHELTEFENINPSNPEKCLYALKYELEYVKSLEYIGFKEYKIFRKEVFKELISYQKERNAKATEFIRGIENSLEYLNHLIK